VGLVHPMYLCTPCSYEVISSVVIEQVDNLCAYDPITTQKNTKRKD